MLISRFQHVNLVSLLGWTIHREEMLLVYELLENGNLETHLETKAHSTRLEVIKIFKSFFVFGVMLLEIVTGKKNTTFSYVRSSTNLLSFVWSNCRDGHWRRTVEESILDSSTNDDQLERCLKIGLGCVQEIAEDRHKMSLVVALLENQSLEIPDPGQPGFFSAAAAPPTSTRHQGESSARASVNQQTQTMISGR
ncbi:unnamed protein product [Thlaspi arvense]|uniref:Serine-threonine/tyrosine-protein kinase catalytic domain-containing protein n=1 Tax=Thlaspi arvense TaxID=13288 RepID=A0AAU9RV49_THLAR|nr:unnamed protein product [Thlaspi arvense]